MSRTFPNFVRSEFIHQLSDCKFLRKIFASRNVEDYCLLEVTQYSLVVISVVEEPDASIFRAEYICFEDGGTRFLRLGKYITNYTATMRSTGLWTVTPCSLEVYGRSEEHAASTFSVVEVTKFYPED
jgi:hypothetical protein